MNSRFHFLVIKGSTAALPPLQSSSFPYHHGRPNSTPSPVTLLFAGGRPWRPGLFTSAVSLNSVRHTACSRQKTVRKLVLLRLPSPAHLPPRPVRWMPKHPRKLLLSGKKMRKQSHEGNSDLGDARRSATKSSPEEILCPNLRTIDTRPGPDRLITQNIVMDRQRRNLRATGSWSISPSAHLCSAARTSTAQLAHHGHSPRRPPNAGSAQVFFLISLDQPVKTMKKRVARRPFNLKAEKVPKTGVVRRPSNLEVV